MRGQLAQQIVAVLVPVERTDPIPEALRGEHPPSVPHSFQKRPGGAISRTGTSTTCSRNVPKTVDKEAPDEGTCTSGVSWMVTCSRNMQHARARAPRRGNAAPGHREPRPARSRCPRLRPPLRKRRGPPGSTRWRQHWGEESSGPWRSPPRLPPPPWPWLASVPVGRHGAVLQPGPWRRSSARGEATDGAVAVPSAVCEKVVYRHGAILLILRVRIGF